MLEDVELVSVLAFFFMLHDDLAVPIRATLIRAVHLNANTVRHLLAEAIIRGDDDRLLVVVGPCSIHGKLGPSFRCHCCCSASSIFADHVFFLHSKRRRQGCYRIR